MDEANRGLWRPPTTEPRLDPTSSLGRIEVRPPYLSLTQVSRDRDALVAQAAAEAPSHGEVGPMTGAEMGRHAAIAGSLALAQAQGDDRRRFYLARHAECRFVPHDAAPGTPVALRATAQELDKRGGTARIDLTAEGAPLASFTVTYAILQEATFVRLFQRHRRPIPAGVSPYDRLLREDVTVDADRAEVTVDAIEPETCAGHFPAYPALPVAVLMGQLSYLAGRLMPGRFRVTWGEVSAQDLAWAGERVRFEAVRVGSEPRGVRFHCRAEAGAAGEVREVGAMDVWLTPA